jgi:hypothetical protein
MPPHTDRSERARSGLTFTELLVLIAGLAVVGFLLLTAYRAPHDPIEARTPPPAPQFHPTPTRQPTLTDYAPHQPVGGEPLRKVLECLGFTVDLPRWYHGREIARRGEGITTGNDSVNAGWFEADGMVWIQELSWQSGFNGQTTLSTTVPGDETIRLLKPARVGTDCWIRCSGGRSVQREIHRSFRFALDCPMKNGYGQEPLLSCLGDSPYASDNVIVLRARTGGSWWGDGPGDKGHWIGGKYTGDYLLCWEASAGGGDLDYQDEIFLVRGVKPVLKL